LAKNNYLRRAVWGGFFIVLGAGLWWIAAHTARFSVKKWDATMETAVKHALTSVGVKDSDVLSSVHEIRKDKKGEWVVHRLSVAAPDTASVNSMVEQLRGSGAEVDRELRGQHTVLVVRHGSRVYQEILIQPR
jgi:hypothetical protein